MREIKSSLAILLFVAAGAALAGAQGLSITQIDTDGLLSAQRTRLYLSAPGLGAGETRKLPELEVWESGDGANYRPRHIARISRSPNEEAGISFLLLLDNSGSMWTDMEGREGTASERLRVNEAQAAARTFLSKLSPKDSVGLAVFNTRYWNAIPPGGVPAEAENALGDLHRPVTDDAYTELYLSMERAIEELAARPGRRVLIVLSDGEDYPYARIAGKPNPETGQRAAEPPEVVERAIRDGVSVYAVRFGAQKDPLLGDVARDSGGRAFDAMDEEELANVYSTIRSDVLAEIAVDYLAGMDRGEKRFVRVAAIGEGATRLVAERYYYAGTVLGQNAEKPRLWYFALVLLVALLWLAMVLFKLERETDRAGLRLLFGPGGQGTRFFELSGPQTVVGAARDADISIAGNPSLKASHATILFDEARKAYTVVADSPITVNNRSVSRKRLEPGDVINMAGTVVVFDEVLAKRKKGN
jgi:Ca-activated chloride channel family protein